MKFTEAIQIMIDLLGEDYIASSDPEDIVEIRRLEVLWNEQNLVELRGCE